MIASRRSRSRSPENLGPDRIRAARQGSEPDAANRSRAPDDQGRLRGERNRRQTQILESFHPRRASRGPLCSTYWARPASPRGGRVVTLRFHASRLHRKPSPARCRPTPLGRIELPLLPGIHRPRSGERHQPEAGPGRSCPIVQDGRAGFMDGAQRGPISVRVRGPKCAARAQILRAPSRSGAAVYVKELLQRPSVGRRLARDQRAFRPGDYELVLKDHDVSIEVANRARGAEGRAGVGDLEENGSSSSPIASRSAFGGWSRGGEEVPESSSADSSPTRAVPRGCRFDSFPAHPFFESLGRVYDPRSLGDRDSGVRRSDQQSGRDIGEEFRYILERKQAKRIAGKHAATPGPCS